MAPQIRPARLVDRGRHGDDVKIGLGKQARVIFIAQRRLLEIARRDLARAVVARTQLIDDACG